MGELFTTLDMIIFFGTLLAAMAVGLIAGRNEETSEDYFLAGRKIPWWGVAGSIFGSNVSANHMIGMMGIGFSVGFAQSHFELGAIAGLMFLCYGFLPVYRKLKVYTLSEYLGRRYDDRSRISYAIIMVLIMAVVQMAPALYIGARSACVLLGGNAVTTQTAAVELVGDSKPANDPPAAVAAKAPPKEIKVNMTYYTFFVIALGLISASYTIFGGLKAVIWTDVIQSVLMLASGILVAWLTFSKLGGWNAMIALDAASESKMHLYLPTNHPDLPWTGVFTGLMALHFFYWGTNQFIVQRALAAPSDREARLGIVVAGFLKLLIPFFAIAAGVAAFYLFRREMPGRSIDADTAFPELVKLVIPVGVGVMGLIAAGLIGAILSTIDSMMNSAATIISIDLYKRYIHPQATDKQMIFVGRASIVFFVIMASLLAIFVLDPNSKKNFFLEIVNYQGYLTPGLLIAFIMGMFWKRGTANAGFATILAGIVFSGVVHFGYIQFSPYLPAVTQLFGSQLNFFHRVFIVLILCKIFYIVVSLMGKPDEEKSRLTWTDLGGHRPQTLKYIYGVILVSIGLFALLGWAMVFEMISPTLAAWMSAAWTLAMFWCPLFLGQLSLQSPDAEPRPSLLADDKFWSGLLCAAAMFMMFYFY